MDLKKKIFLLNVAALPVSTALYFFVFCKKDLSLVPNHGNLSQEVSFFSDIDLGGNSKITDSINEENIKGFDFILREPAIIKYAGMDIVFDTVLDVSEFNEVHVDFSGHNLDHMWLFLNVVDTRVKMKTEYMDDRRTLGDLFLKEAENSIVLPLESFKTPDWWYSNIKQNKSDFGEPDFQKLKSISIGTGLNTPVDLDCSFRLKKVVFVKNTTFHFIALFVFHFILMLLCYFYYRKRTNSTIEKIEIQYKPVEVRKNESVETNDFMAYINQHYTNAELNLKEISDETNISQKVISDAISSKFGCNLKTYINKIRVEEAERLMRETDLNFGEIAFNVGFNSSSNFSRVFKKIRNISPSEYLQSIGK